MNTPNPRNLDDALANLPRELAPPRDLWPQVARAIAAAPAASAPPPARAPWPFALAASLAIVGLLGALVWSLQRTPAGTALLAQQSGNVARDPAALPASHAQARDTAYVAARTALEKTFRERLVLLAPATRARVEADLEIIRKANADIGAQLARDPASPLLLQLMRSTLRQEIELYTNVNRSTDQLTRRT